MLTSSAGNHAVGSAGMRVRGPSSLSCSTGAGVLINLGRSKIHRITLTEILRDLARPSMRTVTRKTESPTTPYGSTPCATTTRPGIVAYRRNRWSEEFKKALRG